jgi:hypothetical protein
MLARSQCQDAAVKAPIDPGQSLQQSHLLECAYVLDKVGLRKPAELTSHKIVARMGKSTSGPLAQVGPSSACWVGVFCSPLMPAPHTDAIRPVPYHTVR